MIALYNEIDPYCCAWLSNLMDAGRITPGVICDKSIEDILPSELLGYDRVHMFAGIGGWDVALDLAGWGNRRVWTGSTPCQPFSAAGKGAGFADERHLWPAWQHLIAQCKPTVIFGEQVASASDWLGLVVSDLEAMDYAVGCVPIEAACAGAKHKRDRMWFVANSERNKQPWEESRIGTPGRMGWFEQSVPWNTDWESALRSLRAVDDGLQRCVEATDAARNAIVPQVAAQFIGACLDIHGETIPHRSRLTPQGPNHDQY